MHTLAGIFVGGAGTRMGGRAKGLIHVEGEPIVTRLARLMRQAGAEVVLVGSRSEYDELGFRALADEPPGIGPLGGLRALLREAGARDAVAVACDMPRVGLELVHALLGAAPAPVVAPRRAGRWEPLFARYRSQELLPLVDARIARGAHSLQGLLDEVATVELPTSELARALDDWDSPGDIDQR